MHAHAHARAHTHAGTVDINIDQWFKVVQVLQTTFSQLKEPTVHNPMPASLMHSYWRDARFKLSRQEAG